MLDFPKLAWILDKLKAEREHGITLDIAPRKWEQIMLKFIEAGMPPFRSYGHKDDSYMNEYKDKPKYGHHGYGHKDDSYMNEYENKPKYGHDGYCHGYGHKKSYGHNGKKMVSYNVH